MERFENQAVDVPGGADELLVIVGHGSGAAVAGSPDGNSIEAGANNELEDLLGGKSGLK